MFTGLIRDLGKVADFNAGVLSVSVAPGFLDGIRTGDSIAINVVCLSVTAMEKDLFRVFVSEETRRLTTSASMPVGQTVNLEKPMRLGEMLHGHLVQGHVDGLGSVEDLYRKDQSWILKVKYPKELDPYIVHKGSIAVNGISLTVAKKYSLIFEVAVIPETIERTSLKSLDKNSKVNIETDLVAKYVENMIKHRT